MENFDLLISNIYDPNSPDFLTNDTFTLNMLFDKFNITNSPNNMELIFDKLAFIVNINWNNYVIIARALNRLYPDEDLLTITDEIIRQKTIALPNFKDSNYPKDDDYYTAIFTNWNILKNGLF
jgi:Fe-S-cluster formation regulator IscX/YfhJ